MELYTEIFSKSLVRVRERPIGAGIYFVSLFDNFYVRSNYDPVKVPHSHVTRKKREKKKKFSIFRTAYNIVKKRLNLKSGMGIEKKKKTEKFPIRN